MTCLNSNRPDGTKRAEQLQNINNKISLFHRDGGSGMRRQRRVAVLTSIMRGTAGRPTATIMKRATLISGHFSRRLAIGTRMTRMGRINADQPRKNPRKSAASASSAYLLTSVFISECLFNSAHLRKCPDFRRATAISGFAWRSRRRVLSIDRAEGKRFLRAFSKGVQCAFQRCGRGPSLSLPRSLHESREPGFQPADAGGSVKPRMERGSAEPWEQMSFFHISSPLRHKYHDATEQ
jgi:hypothetical protein